MGGADSDDNMLNSVECFDPVSGAWEVVAPMGTARYVFGAAMVSSKVYVIGGVDSDNNTLNTVECFDTATGAWEVVAPMGTARHSFGVAMVGKILSSFSAPSLLYSHRLFHRHSL